MWSLALNLINEHLELVGKAIRSPSEVTLTEWTTLALLGLLIVFVVLAFLWKLGCRLYAWWAQRQLVKDLHPFFSSEEVQKATWYYIPTRCQDFSPTQAEEPRHNIASKSTSHLIPFFMKQAFNGNKDNQRYYLILADSGMGKTTFMINLYLRYATQWFGKSYAIKLVPLGHPKAWETLQRLADDVERARNTILLLDAFDEDPEAAKGADKRLRDLMDLVWEFREVVLTSRSQFFLSEEDEPNELHLQTMTGFHRFWKKYVSPFNSSDIQLYLRKRYGMGKGKKRQQAWEIVENSPNLMVRPMLLNYIDDLLDQETPFACTSDVYEALITAWIERETQRKEKDKRNVFRDELWAFSREIALDIYANREERDGFLMPLEEITRFADAHDIQLEKIEMTSRSLLNRDGAGRYKFAHKSILEWFVAQEAVQDFEFRQTLTFEGMDIAEQFYFEQLFRGIEGSYTTAKNASIKSLKEFETGIFSNLKTLKIKTIKDINLHDLEQFKTAESISVYDHDVLIFLYNIYIVLWVDIYILAELDQRDLIDLIDRRFLRDLLNLRDLRDLRDLRVLRDRLDQRDQRDRLDRLDLIDLIDQRYRRALLNLQDRRDRRDRRDQRDLRVLRDRLMSDIREASDEDWRRVNIFIEDMKYVEAQLPGRRIYY